MKIKHWLALGLLVVGGLYVAHITMSHGGFGSFKSGLGIK